MSARSQGPFFSQVVQGIGSVIEVKSSSEAVRNRGHSVFAKTVTLTPLTPLSRPGRGGEIKNSPLSPCGRGVGGEGDYKNGMLPKKPGAGTGACPYPPKKPGLWYEGYCWAKAQLQTWAKAQLQTWAKAQLQTGANLKYKIYGLKSNHAD